MRTRDKNKDYMNKYRYGKELKKRIKTKEKCFYCENPVQTLHHIDQNHNNNQARNLLGICRKCHLSIDHLIDTDSTFSQQKSIRPHRMPLKRTERPLTSVTAPFSCTDTLKNRNTPVTLNSTIYHPRTKVTIILEHATKRTQELFKAWGYRPYNVQKQIKRKTAIRLPETPTDKSWIKKVYGGGN